MRKLAVVLMLAAGGTAGQENERPILVISAAAAAEAGVEFHRLFAGACALLPLGSRTTGAQAHDVAAVGEPALCALLGFRI